MRGKWLRYLLEAIELAAGTLLIALGYNLFFVPNQIAPGGFTGLATVINTLTGFPIGLFTAILNIPLFLINFKSLGFKATVKSVAASLALSVLLDVLPEGVLTQDMLLASVMGGVMVGAGLGLIIKSGTTTGGTDMAARLLSKALQPISVGTIMYALDFAVIILSGIVCGISNALYALIGLYLSVRIIDAILEGVSSAKVLIIISGESGRIADRLMDALNRGVTSLKGEGMYSGMEKEVLMSVVGRLEVAKAKQIVHDIDEKAFVIVYDAREIMGEGFTYGKTNKLLP